MEITASRKLNLNVPGCYSQVEFAFTVTWEENEVKMKLDELTSEAYVSYASLASEVKSAYETLDTQLGEELSSLREANKNYENRLALAQLYAKKTRELLPEEEFARLNLEFTSDKQYQKITGNAWNESA